MIAETLFGRSERAATKEILGHPASGVIGWIGSNRTGSGVIVDDHVAMTYSACWAATRLLAATAGMIPLNLKRRVKVGGKIVNEMATDHRLWRILHDAPNDEMSSMMMRVSGVNHQVNRGGFFAEIERSNGGDVIALWPIHPKRVKVFRRDKKSLWYRVFNTAGQVEAEIAAENMLHVPSLISEDGITGKGVIEYAMESIGMGVATEKHGAAYFGNGAVPVAVITHPGKLSDVARRNFRQEWKEIYGGPDKSNEIGLLAEGSDIKKMSFNAEECQFLETRQHNVEEIARWYGVPPHMIAHLLRSTNNNIEQQSIEFVRYNLMPWLCLWEAEIWRKLLNEEEKNQYFARFDVDELMRGELATRTSAWKAQFLNGKSTLNEWRMNDGQNPIGPLGDLHFVPLNMTTLEKAASAPLPSEAPAVAEPPKKKPAKSDKGEIIEAARAVVHDALARMIRVEANAARTAAKKPGRFHNWLEEFQAKHAETMLAALNPSRSLCIAAVGSVYFERMIAAHLEATREQLLTASDTKPADFAEAIDACAAKWEATKADELTHQILNVGELADAA